MANYSVDDLESSNNTFINGEYTVLVSGLRPFREYTVRVRAHTSVGPGSFANAVMVITDPSAPLEPTNVTASVLNSTAILLSWSYPQQPNGLILGYIIQTNATLSFSLFPDGVEIISPSEVNLTLGQLNDMTSQDLIFANLTPFTVYSFRVQALAVQVADNSSEFAIHEGVFSREETAVTDQAGEKYPLVSE